MLTKEFALGRYPSVPDKNNYMLSSFMPYNLGSLDGEKLWAFNSEPLDQGDQPECLGFGLADYCISDPTQDPFTNADGRSFYKMCKVIDGDNEAGSTVHTGAKVLRNIGRIQNYAFALTINEVVYWVLNESPVVMGTEWTMDMFMPDKNNVVHPTGKVAGGHCWVATGKTTNGLLRIKCAWGYGWGVKSEAFIAIEDAEKLLARSGEALAAVELPLSAVVTPQRDGCSIAAITKLFGLLK